MTNIDQHTRRQFFRRGALSLAPVALSSLSSAATHFPARAKSVIFLFQIGGPSQLDLFDPKPELRRLDGQPLPDSQLKKLKFAQIQEKRPSMMGSPWRFRRHGQVGATVSELLPHTSRIVDQISLVRTVKTDDTNHMFAELLMNTGWRQFGHPSIGSWVVYGLGSVARDLPAFVVLRSGMRPRSKAANYGHGFLPPNYQGTPFRASGDPILNLASPPGFDRNRQRQTIQAIQQLNQQRLAKTGDDEIAARIASYEMAFRMQSSAPELLDLKQESAATLKMYGIDNHRRPSYARNCLLARRMVERGVRFVQVFHGDWDHHGNIKHGLPAQCRVTDQGSAALIRDLAQRGLLDETLVIWGGELGRSSVAQKGMKPGAPVGRDHHIDAFAMWFAGGGVKSGQVIGETDELGCQPVTKSWHIYDVQATILHLLGINHEELTYRYQGRDFRLTDVHGEVQTELFA